ncbi:DUF4296 domain-containing protein [Mucilaginibacter conchicola]|uniref:DUF4296 domain-containing protein n=1 Tax=Mucilaginibacter conchicola TaxID=2303333 RepID=A0A372NVZ5_9SPHI|nr:DUF4296 domain-containing protein [Mucilaginibacter conchicola]RFZ94300.1 DUF4296 domain-containing protein [Mucilaginibacter conchicola]
MQKYISLFFSVLLFAACKPAAKTPPNIIDEQKMIKLLTDLHITDGELYTITPVPDTLFKYGREKYLALFKRHHVTEKQYDDSFKYYSQNPEKIQAIYNEVDKILKAKLDSIRTPAKNTGQANAKKPGIVNIQKPKPDSIKANAIDSVQEKKRLKQKLDSLTKSAKKRMRPNPLKSQK